MLDVAHDWRLVLASLAIALMAGFTGLSLTRGASRLDVPRRKAVVSMAAVALGGGIWSMHFVAMLGLQLPILFYYDALITLISALVAILVAGVALLILHFRPRTPGSITVAGTIIGAGIPLMHYIGMSGIELCRPVYTSFGIAAALVASVGLSILAMRIAYGERGRRNILLGTLGFGVAVVVVHFAAMAGTGFVATATTGQIGPQIGNEALAMVVTVSAFLISAAFLLTGVTFAPDPALAVTPMPDIATPVAPAEPVGLRIPHEREGRTFFIDHTNVGAIRAEGHYTLLMRGTEALFCPWSISEAQERLSPLGFIRVHRSFLLNPAHVARFERGKDSGQCWLEGNDTLRVPVARARLPDLRAALGV
ncbi:MAG: MHYT domain-containing protein [Paracoccaceae bacterium]